MIIDRNNHRIGHHDPENKISILRDDPGSEKQPFGDKEFSPIQIVPAKSLDSESSDVLLPGTLEGHSALPVFRDAVFSL